MYCVQLDTFDRMLLAEIVHALQPVQSKLSVVKKTNSNQSKGI